MVISIIPNKCSKVKKSTSNYTVFSMRNNNLTWNEIASSTNGKIKVFANGTECKLIQKDTVADISEINSITIPAAYCPANDVVFPAEYWESGSYITGRLDLKASAGTIAIKTKGGGILQSSDYTVLSGSWIIGK